MRKALSSILVLILLLGMVIPASAAGTPTLSISSGEVKAGESVTLTVSIKDNPGIASTLVYIYYDVDSFTVNPDDDISPAGSFSSSGDIIGNTIELAKQNGRYNGKIDKDGVLALWYNGTGMNTNGDGALLTIQLHAKSNAANGEYKIEVDVSNNETFTETSETLTPKTVGGVVTVSGGTGEKKPDDGNKEAVEFKDISGHWAESYIKQSAGLGLVEGYEGLYRPNDKMTRAEFVTILWRSVGEPEPKGKASFTDLKQDWYFKSVAWAEENQIVNGMGGGLFDPTGNVTREQLVTILHRMAGTPTGMEIMLSDVYDGQYSDSGNIGEWAKAALYWSIYEGIYCGENAEAIGSTLAPKNPANRAQIAVMMIRYLNEKQ